MSKEHDITKSMLETIRKAESDSRKNLIENLEDNLGGETNVENDDNVVDTEGTEETEVSDGEDLGNQEALEQQDTFVEQVGPSDFGFFKLYPETGNAVFNGKLKSGLEWQVSANDGMYINMDNVELDDKLANQIKKLNAFGENFKIEWEERMRKEYSNKTNDEL